MYMYSKIKRMVKLSLGTFTVGIGALVVVDSVVIIVVVVARRFIVSTVLTWLH